MRKSLARVLPMLLIAAASLSANAKDSRQPPKQDVLTIKGCAKKKPPVLFNHKNHVKFITETLKKDCQVCHHLVKGKQAEKNRCSDCHITPQGEKGMSCQEMSPAKNPFHKVCISCHKEQKATHAKAPTACKDCHKTGS